jgi:hypothetical protein
MDWEIWGREPWFSYVLYMWISYTCRFVLRSPLVIGKWVTQY